MKKFIFIFTCFVLFTNSAFSQDQGSDTCVLGTKIFSSRLVEGVGQLYYSTNVISGKIDTLFFGAITYRKITCKCNDTLVSFFNDKTVNCFQKNGDKWKFKTSFALHDPLDVVGVLAKGEKYETYSNSYILTAPDQIAAVLSIFKQDEATHKIIYLEKYDIIYKIDIPNYKIVTLSKTLKND
jgi:hypothetical protein